MPAKDRAAYMREYRKRQKLRARGLDVSDDIVLTIDMPGGGRDTYRAKDQDSLTRQLAAKITSLEAEVIRLERELDLTHTLVGPLTTTRSGVFGPDPRCDIVRNGDQFVCRIHHRYWDTGICPGLGVGR